jgi:carboxypeptidase PM20D1
VKLKENPFPAELNYTINSFMDYIGPEMPFVQRMAFANRWLFSPLIKSIYSSKPGADAMIRTTTAPTIFQSGIKENVIPSTAKATINFRTQPGITTNYVIDYVKENVNDKRIKISVRGDNISPKAVANVSDSSFRYLQLAIRSWRKDVIVIPYLTLGATDGRYFSALTPQVYRFIPFNDIKGFHGVNEMVGVDEYKKAIQFYYYLIKGRYLHK